MGQELEGVSGLKVVDLGVGMAGALTAKLLAEAGAQVTRIAPTGGDPFDAVYPAHATWRAGEKPGALADLDRLISEADVCLIGGEDFPGLEWRFDADELARQNPRLVVVAITAYIEGAAPGPAVDLLVQARTGLVNEQLADRPVRFAMALPNYGAALMAHVGLWSALVERERTGKGRIVRTSLQQGTALFWSQIWMDATNSDAAFDKLPPKGVKHLIFECGDGGYVHFVLGVPGALSTVYRILAIDDVVDPNERGMPTLARGAASYFGDAAKLGPAILKWKQQELLEAFWAAGIPVEPVLGPGECWDEGQIEANGTVRRNPDGGRSVGMPISVSPGRGAGAHAGAASDAAPAQAGPLSGLRVVDIGNFIAGPFASKHLADYGADVIKVEPPNGLANLTGLRNVSVSNRGKRSICIDAKAPDGDALIRRLCERADLVHHNFRLGVAERMRFDPTSLHALKPDLIVLQTRAYGSHGPKAARPGFDMIMQALCGHEVRGGGQGNPPMWYRSALIDYATGTLGAIAALIGLYERARTGLGAEAEASLLSTALFMMSELIQRPDGSFEGAPLLNNQKTGFHPAEQIYQTQDGWVAVAARSDAMADAFATALGLNEDLGPRASWGEDEAALIGKRTAAMATKPLLDLLRTADVWAEACVQDGWAALRDDANARERNLVIRATDATYGEVTSTFGPLINLLGWSPNALGYRSAPACGEHTREILSELGLDDAAIDDLYERKVVA